MRRPLADAGLFFVLIIFIIQLIRGIDYPDFSNLADKQITVTGTLARIEYKEKDNTTQTIVYIKDLVFPDKMPVHGITSRDMLVCYMKESEPLPKLGTCCRLSGTVRVFEPAYNPGNFDSRQYNHILHNVGSLSGASVREVIGTPDSIWWAYKNALYDIRHILSQLCDLCFPGDDSGIAKTMLLGDRSSLDSETKSLYSQNGIAHILAISGLHISLIGSALYGLLKKIKLPTIICCIVSVWFMISFGILTGMATSATRAIIMFSLKMLAALVHRTYDTPTALVSAAVLILIDQPEYIFYSGFLFSFGAIVALIIVIPRLQNLFPKILSAGIGINLTTLPLYLYNYYYFPFFSLLLNLYVIPLMSVLLILMIIALAAGAVYLPLGRLLAIPAHLILIIYNYSCELGNRIPFNKMVTGQPHAVQIVTYIVMLTIILYLSSYFPKAISLTLLMMSCILLTSNLRTGISVSCIDVGQGDSIYISNNHTANILMDAGSSSNSDVGKYRISPYLLSQGCSTLDAVFVSHLDADHINGLKSMIEGSGISSPRIKAVIFPASVEGISDDTYQELCQLISSKKINLLYMQKGDSYRIGKYAFYCLYPDENCHGEDTNAESMVLWADLGNASVLLTGDLEGKGEADVTDTLKLMSLSDSSKLRILKAAHHGSRNSTTDEFLEAYKPKFALISAGRGNSYGHPHAETLSRLASHKIKYISTQDHGAITVNIKNANARIYGYVK